MAVSTLAAIRTKVRRLTRNVSPDQLTDTAIDEYVNTFIAYDFPEHLRLFTLRRNFSFYTQPNVDQYETTTGAVTDPLFNFKNVITTVHPPIYINGFESRFTLSQEQFFLLYPQLNTSFQLGTGDGITTFFSGTITPVPILQRSIVVNGISANNSSDVFIDDPQTNATGNLVIPNNTSAVVGTINYITGAITVTFLNAPAQDEPVNVLFSGYQAARPNTVLFFDNKFFLRPVPDQSYQVKMEVFIRPTQLMQATDIPEMEQWWQWIAYGAAKKVLEDKNDIETIQTIMPEYKMQERLVLRRTLVELANQRAATIYTEQTSLLGSNSWDWTNSP